MSVYMVVAMLLFVIPVSFKALQFTMSIWPALVLIPDHSASGIFSKETAKINLLSM